MVTEIQLFEFTNKKKSIVNGNKERELFFFPPGATTPIVGCILQPSSGL